MTKYFLLILFLSGSLISVVFATTLMYSTPTETWEYSDTHMSWSNPTTSWEKDYTLGKTQYQSPTISWEQEDNGSTFTDPTRTLSQKNGEILYTTPTTSFREKD